MTRIAAGPKAETPAHAASSPGSPKPDILNYISMSWDHLTRSLDNCATYTDVKVEGEPILYLPIDVPTPPDIAGIEQRCKIRVLRLPEKITKAGEVDQSRIGAEGLLYLEHPYVVPGGQFNEMYGWDSYFIILGLLRDSRRELAKGMVENFFYEIEHYGGVLNANRTYYLTRSQPPFLTSMILAVYEADKAAGQADPKWLEKAYQYAVRDYSQWNQDKHVAGDTGLSRYFDYGEGPVPEIMGDPSNYYRGVVQYLLLHEGPQSPYLVKVDGEHPPAGLYGNIYRFSRCAEGSAKNRDRQDCSKTDAFALTRHFYKGDRAMRESGFDVTFRFGPFGAETHRFAPVCLNSLLYKEEKDLESIAETLGRSGEAKQWNAKAEARKENIDRYLWDSSRGLFFDYNFRTQTRSTYDYITTFYPLWAGLASPQQAEAVIRNLKLFEQPGGLVTSRFDDGTQWDYPYGWAPVELLAIEGLRRYGDAPDADRIAADFLSVIIKNYRFDHTIREKYDVVKGTDRTHIAEGYRQNFIGFGWTNGVFLDLWHRLPPDRASHLIKGHQEG